MRPSSVARVAICAVLAAWGLPSAVGFVLGLHLAAHHHHDDHTAATAFAMAHGHEHDLNVPPHDHEATKPNGATFPVASASIAFISSPTAPPGPLGEFRSPAPQRSHSPPSAATLTPLRL